MKVTHAPFCGQIYLSRGHRTIPEAGKSKQPLTSGGGCTFIKVPVYGDGDMLQQSAGNVLSYNDASGNKALFIHKIGKEND